MSSSRILGTQKLRANFLSFQQVQGVNALGAAIRFFPEVALGIILNLCTGLFVDRIHANHLITGSSIIATASPLIMALIDPEWNYWRAAFWAVLLCPVNVDGTCPLLCVFS